MAISPKIPPLEGLKIILAPSLWTSRLALLRQGRLELVVHADHTDGVFLSRHEKAPHGIDLVGGKVESHLEILAELGTAPAQGPAVPMTISSAAEKGLTETTCKNMPIKPFQSVTPSSSSFPP